MKTAELKDYLETSIKQSRQYQDDFEASNLNAEEKQSQIMRLQGRIEAWLQTLAIIEKREREANPTTD